MANRQDLVGQKFNHWTVQEFDHMGAHGFSFWKCKCVCGNERVIARANLVHNKSKCCGCLNKLLKGQAAKNQLYRVYKANAKKRNLQLTLTVEQLVELCSKNCYYCGSVPSKSITEVHDNRYNGDFIYNGIDRVDNGIGYVIDNCIPCCETCNKARRDMPQEKFIEWLDALSKYRIKIMKINE